MVKAQEWLERSYPSEEGCREKNNNQNQNYGLKINQIIKLNMVGMHLTGALNLNSFFGLRRLEVRSNQITYLELTGLRKLEILDCSFNKLTSLDFLKGLNKNKIRALDIGHNNFPASDLTPFNKFVNLELLGLGNSKFYDSLEPLHKLNRLKGLDIEDTDIDSGLEYLPKSVETFCCSVNERQNAKVKTIYDLFKNEQGVVYVSMNDGHEVIKNFPQNLQEYKQKLVKEKAHELLKEEFQEQTNQINELQMKLTQFQQLIEQLQTNNQNLSSQNNQLKEQINQLQKDLIISNLQNQNQTLIDENIQLRSQLTNQTSSINQSTSQNQIQQNQQIEQVRQGDIFRPYNLKD